MALKSIDTTFVQYGIRKDDMALLETLCVEYRIDVDWMRELLRTVHVERLKHEELDDKAVEKLMEQVLNHLRTSGELKFYS